MLLPALFASAAGYLVFVGINGTTPLFSVGGPANLDARDLVSAIGLGLVAGLAARLFAAGVRAAKGAAERYSPTLRIGAAGLSIAGLVVASKALTGATLAIGPGYRTIAWAAQPSHAVGVVVGMLAIRTCSTLAAITGGGAGGSFIPLVPSRAPSSDGSPREW